MLFMWRVVQAAHHSLPIHFELPRLVLLECTQLGIACLLYLTLPGHLAGLQPPPTHQTSQLPPCYGRERVAGATSNTRMQVFVLGGLTLHRIQSTVLSSLKPFTGAPRVSAGFARYVMVSLAMTRGPCTHPH